MTTDEYLALQEPAVAEAERVMERIEATGDPQARARFWEIAGECCARYAEWVSHRVG